MFFLDAQKSTPSPGLHTGYNTAPQTFNFAFLSVPAVLIGVIYCTVIYYKYISGHTDLYRSRYKNEVIANMTRLIQPEMTYSPRRGISKQTFTETGLYSTGIDRYSSEDLFAGKIGKTAMMFSELHAEEKRTQRNSRGHTTTHWVTIFKGLLAIVDFNKHFRSWLVIKPDFAEKSFGWLGRTIQNFSPDLVRLENPEFENAFVVHGGDQVEARYILTPDLQERLLDLRKHFGNDIRIAFYNSRMHLTIPNQNDWFEPNLHTPAHNTRQMQRFLHQMSSVFRIVTILDLNTRIWTKD